MKTCAAAQSRLKEGGFYFGDANGTYNSETSAAVTRYQIRHGLAISGQLDAATAKALGVAPTETTDASPPSSSDTWRRLRKSDEQFLRQLNSGAIPPPGDRVQPHPLAPPPAPANSSPLTPPAPAPIPADNGDHSGVAFSRERLRDYVGAFVLAGLDPQVGAELEFFADRVSYFGERNVHREKIQNDLLRYDRRWPERRFWLAGEMEVQRQAGGD